MLIDANVEKGFAQKDDDVPVPEEPVLYWPQTEYDGTGIDFRTIDAAHPGPLVTTFVPGDDTSVGWITACNPARRLLVGYGWHIGEYPWLSMWRDVQRGRPAAFGMEFGTTGLHQQYAAQVRKGTIWGRRLYEYIDAGATTEKSYLVFLATVPDDFRGVAALTVRDGAIELTAHGDERIVIVEAGIITDM